MEQIMYMNSKHLVRLKNKMFFRPEIFKAHFRTHSNLKLV